VRPLCSDPIADDLLLDWWSGELAAGGRGVDEHLLACDSCAERLGELRAMANGIGRLVQRGSVPGVILPAVLERLRRGGRRVREYRVPPGGSVRCTVGPEDDVLLSRLSADFRGARRVDLVSRVEGGTEQRLTDVPFDPASEELLLVPPLETIRTLGAHVMRFRLVAVEPAGERLLGEYTFNHRPWPGW
jgi:hypothetical protein